MKAKNDWKKREGVVYSTSSEFEYTYGQSQNEETLPPDKQDLRVSLDKKMRAGKQVTIVTGFVGSPADLEQLVKMLKTKCGTGGSAKEGVAVIQGDVRMRVVELLKASGYKVKQSG